MNEQQQLFSDWNLLWRAPERLPLSQWAEKHFYLSEYSAKTGRLQLRGYQREPLDAFTDPRVAEIVLKCGTQLLKTLLIQAAMAYIAVEDPGPALVSQPKEDDAETFSKERLAPMIRDMPVLNGRIAEAKTRSSASSTTLFKQFPGGSWSIVGALAPGNAARRTIRYYFADEVNKYEPTKEGPFTVLADERTAPFRTRARRVYVCSPTTPDGEITRRFDNSDQRYPWVPCPYCGRLQRLSWSQVSWDDSLPFDDRPESATYLCSHPECGRPWDDIDRWNAADKPIWIAERPFRGIAGFGGLGHLHSPDKKLSQMVRAFLFADKAAKSGDTDPLRAFVNTNLAEEWEERGEAPDWQILLDRREDYPGGTVPAGGLFVVCGADVHPDRIEAEAVSFGKDKQSWSVAYEIFLGRTSEPKVWAEFEAFTHRTFPHPSGAEIPISRTFVDSGNNSNDVYNWVRTQDPDRVVAIKGYDGGTLVVGQPSPVDVTVDGKKLANGLRIKTVKVTFFKSGLYADLRKKPPTAEEQASGAVYPAGYCHFPKDARNYGDEHFKQLCAEQLVTRKNRKTGRHRAEFIQTRDRNEALDCRVYARAAAWDFGLDQALEIHWQALEASLMPVETETPQVPVPDDPAPMDHGASRSRDPWVEKERVAQKKNWFKR